MHDAARRVRALLTVGIVILAGFSVSTFSGQFVAVQSGPPPSPQSIPEPAKGTGILIGQVVEGVDGKRGIGGALVAITGTGASQSPIVLANGDVVSAGGPARPAGPNDPPRQVLTDSSGRFMFRNLAAGRYSIRATASPYLSGAYGATRAGGGGQTIELTRDDEKRDGIVIKMWKGATISGTVVDEAGEPAIGVPIKYIRRTVSGGRTRLVAYSSESTDDRGAYRIADLTPGDYFVGVIASSTTMPVSTADAMTQARYSGASITTSDVYRELMSSTSSVTPLLLGGGGGYRVGDFMFQQNGYLGGSGTFNGPAPGQDGRVLAYPSTFYPGVGVIAQATPITVASGEDRARIDLQLKLVPAMRVSGVVMGPDGPLRNLGLRLLPTGADEFTSDTQIEAASSVTDANGAFTFLGVTPGAYTLKSLRIPRPTPVAVSRGASSGVEVTGPGGLMMSMSSSSGPVTTPPLPLLPTEPTLWASMAVSVNDRDVNGLVVTLRGGAKLSGRIVFEGNAEKPTPDQVQQTAITVSAVGASPSVAAVLRRVDPDGTFATNGYPAGKYLISASPPPSAGGKWRFKSATQGGRIVSDEGLDLQGGDAGGLVITFTDQPGEISGSVQNERGTPDQTGSVVLLPADSTAWKDGVINARRLRSVRLTTTGSFTFGDLPPGAYFVAAITGDLPENWQLAATLDAISRLGSRVVVADGAKVSQSLTSRPIR